MSDEFRPLPSARRHAEKLDRSGIPFVVAAMFTSGSKDDAKRLKASLDASELNYVLYQVPTVHRSISTKGSDDIAYCKANFIHHVMGELRRPILYVDADVVFRAFPAKISEIAGAADFAIYNWIADSATDGYKPVPLRFNGVKTANRFYQFSHSIDMLDPGQLLCSGAVQFYDCSDRARHLLAAWLGAVTRYPGVADDELLDFAFNTTAMDGTVKAVWLDKDYCRYPWWIHVRPVVDHPAFPAPADPGRSFAQAAGRHRFDASRVKPQAPQGPFPRDCLIDTKDKWLVQIVGGMAIPVRRLEQELWLGNS